MRLSREDIEFLKRNTRYSEKEIREWFSGFIDVCPSGEIDRQSIADIYAMPKRNADKFIDQMFKMFDQDGDGNISFRVSESTSTSREDIKLGAVIQVNLLFSTLKTPDHPAGVRAGHKPHHSGFCRGQTEVGLQVV